MTNPNLEQFAAAQKANAEVMANLLRTAFGGLEKLTALNLNTGRDLFDTSVANAQKLMAVKDPAEVSKLGTTLAQPGVEKLVAYSQNVYDLVTSLQKEVSAVVESQYQAFTKNAATAAEQAKTAPVGGDVFAAALNSVIEASNKAFENMNAAAKQMADLAETNVKAAAEAAAKATPVAAAAPAEAPAAAKPAAAKKK